MLGIPVHVQRHAEEELRQKLEPKKFQQAMMVRIVKDLAQWRKIATSRNAQVIFVYFNVLQLYSC